VDQYIQRMNINLYQERLAETSDAVARKVLLKLLAEERAKGDPLKSRWISGWLASELQPPK
jgi:hypothetical protein